MEGAREGILDRGNSRGCFGKIAIKFKSSYHGNWFIKILGESEEL